MRAFDLVRAHWRRDLLTEASYRANFAFGLSGGLFAVLTFFFLGQLIEEAAPGLSGYRGGYFPFVLIGLAVTALLREALTGFARRVRQAQLVGTLEAVLASPVSPTAAILCESVFPLFGAGLRASLYLGVGALLFGAQIETGGIPLAVLVLFLGMASFVALGVLSASATMVLKRGDPVAWAVSSLSVLLSGVYYPVEVLPTPLKAMAQVLPMTHVLKGLREALLGGGSDAAMEAVTILAVFAVVLVPLALGGFAWGVQRARHEGSLTHF